MAHIHPFHGLTPPKEIAKDVVSYPFDTYKKVEVEKIVKSNPCSFLNVIKPELSTGKRTKPYEKEAQRNSRLMFERFEREGYLKRAAKPCYYVYRQVKGIHSYTGILGAIEAEDYLNGIIRIHEQTLSEKEDKLQDYLATVGLNAEPVMFTYPSNQALDNLIHDISALDADIFIEKDGMVHQVWCVSDDQRIALIEEAFAGLSHVYIADGHHRTASSVLLSQNCKSKGVSADSAVHRLLGIFIPSHSLQLFAFNRLIKVTGELQIDFILERLNGQFDIECLGEKPFEPLLPHEFSMYLNGVWYKLRLAHMDLNIDFTHKLDALILNTYILKPVFGIEDIRADKRVGFVSGIFGVDGIKSAVDSGVYQVGFGLFPVEMEQFFRFSDEGRIMPPKTTWFEPKLLNGLVVYDLEPNQYA